VYFLKIYILAFVPLLKNVPQDSVTKQISVDLEIRPRFEFRENYRLTSEQTLDHHMWATQRNRINAFYSDRLLKAYASFQQIHLFNYGAIASGIGNINFNELYVETKIGKSNSARIGRQNFQLDNGRMFSAAPWSQQNRSHEGIRLIHQSPNFDSDLAVFFTRDYKENYNPSFSPVASHKYEYLLVYHLLKRQNNWTYTFINSAELLGKTYANSKRYASGGRLEFRSEPWYTTLSGYYQFGRNFQQQKVNAYYIQPEIALNLRKFNFRLGTELLSGNRFNNQNNISHSYEIPYGVAWKFMGNMNFYAKFPSDLNEKGLVNPYFFSNYKVSPILSLRIDNHLFYSQYQLKAANRNYLGFETDFSFSYEPAKYVLVTGGLSFYLPEESTLLLEKIKSETAIPVWSYLSIAFKPNLFTINK
jgi:hypothetical protein